MANLRSIEPEGPSDQELIERTLAGDGEAYAEIVGRYQRQVYRVVFSILRNDAEADTVTQDTFVQGYLHLSRFEGRSGLATWLTRIAINRSRDSLRSRRLTLLTSWDEQDEHAPSVHPVDEEPDAERRAMATQLRAAIERAVQSLSAQQKIVFRLRHFEERSLEEIAELMGLSSGTVRAHLFRAIRAVRRELAGWRPAPEGDSR